MDYTKKTDMKNMRERKVCQWERGWIKKMSGGHEIMTIIHYINIWKFKTIKKVIFNHKTTNIGRNSMPALTGYLFLLNWEKHSEAINIVWNKRGPHECSKKEVLLNASVLDLNEHHGGTMAFPFMVEGKQYETPNHYERTRSLSPLKPKISFLSAFCILVLSSGQTAVWRMV